MSSAKLYYFDYNATTPVAPEVRESMLPFLKEYWGNPSSGYQFGHEAATHLEMAREKVAALIGADPREILFTSCGTESNNAALHSALAGQAGKRHVLMTAAEHSANLRYGEYLQRVGYEVTFLPVLPDGSLDLALLEQSIRPDTAVVSAMWANNETGVLFPVPEIAGLCRTKGVLFHTDAVQMAGKLEIDVRDAGVDLLSLSAHKLNAPKGIGALYIRRGLKFHPLLIGGQQERGRRGGTENVPHIVGFGRAAELALSHVDIQTGRVRQLRDRLEQMILERIPGTERNGAREPRLPNTSNIGFEAVEAEAVLIQLDRLGICASGGSACTSGSLEPSHVLKAMGQGPARARSAIRWSLGIETTAAEVDYVLEHLPPIIARLRALVAPG